MPSLDTSPGLYVKPIKYVEIEESGTAEKTRFKNNSSYFCCINKSFSLISFSYFLFVR